MEGWNFKVVERSRDLSVVPESVRPKLFQAVIDTIKNEYDSFLRDYGEDYEFSTALDALTWDDLYHIFITTMLGGPDTDMLWYIAFEGTETYHALVGHSDGLVIDSSGKVAYQIGDYVVYKSSDDPYSMDAERQAVYELVFQLPLDPLPEPEPAVVAELPRVIFGYTLRDLPDGFTAHIPEGDVHDCFFYFGCTDAINGAGNVFSDIPEPSIPNVNEGLKVAEYVMTACRSGLQYMEFLDCTSKTRIDYGFHTADAPTVRDWFTSRGFKIIPISTAFEHLAFLKLDRDRMFHWRFRDDENYSSLDELMPGVYALGLERTGEVFEIRSGDEKLTVNRSDLTRGQFTTLSFP